MTGIPHEQWSPSGVYLNTASYGLPPLAGWEALQSALADWRGGRTSWEHWGQATDASRTAWARLVGVAPGDVAVGATVSGFVGLLAASLPLGARILTPNVEFTSTLFPLLVPSSAATPRFGSSRLRSSPRRSTSTPTSSRSVPCR